ncbi:hypothetical protein DFJ69_6286 [Thermomonospora umbrina]|uniref:Uncharacterized protein n=1 Tax=Thermomonospora umbrina TaxID=111806 RepID=A0A3D9T646_9ACTN|nr:hypothetical protein DFJ69_6286 [Thermomonospora umbrina]
MSAVRPWALILLTRHSPVRRCPSVEAAPLRRPHPRPSPLTMPTPSLGSAARPRIARPGRPHGGSWATPPSPACGSSSTRGPLSPTHPRGRAAATRPAAALPGRSPTRRTPIGVSGHQGISVDQWRPAAPFGERDVQRRSGRHVPARPHGTTRHPPWSPPTCPTRRCTCAPPTSSTTSPAAASPSPLSTGPPDKIHEYVNSHRKRPGVGVDTFSGGAHRMFSVGCAALRQARPPTPRRDPSTDLGWPHAPQGGTDERGRPHSLKISA